MKSSRYTLPRVLPAGGTIGVFSPAGAPKPERVARGVEQLHARGYRCIIAPHAIGEHEYFSAPDDVRLADFNALLADPSIDMMMMSRGGYGLSRIVHRIDWRAVAASRKILCGFSDFTAVNLAALAQGGYVTIAGPGVATDFADYDANVAEDHAFMEAHFWPAVLGGDVSVEVIDPHPYAAQVIQGPIWGSNLSLLCDLGGSPFIPDVAGGILFIEEIGERPYTIERMFYQLYHSGILARQAAIVLGDFTDCEPAPDRYPYSLEHVVNTLRQLLPIPVLTHLPFGHVPKKICVPYGADATLAIADGRYTLSY
ncbi:MAG: LD-carboxypeptidase [Burkholderiales bacterium]|jgi:muramoyltetrapeptide carboxypeptidase|nr:LD-carboxypeptidase [Nitrosomonadaceae bacterium]